MSGLQSKLGAVSALPLGGVQGAVRPIEDSASVVSRVGFDEAGTEGIGSGRFPVPKSSASAFLPNLFDEAGRIDQARVRQDEQELFAPHATDKITSS